MGTGKQSHPQHCQWSCLHAGISCEPALPYFWGGLQDTLSAFGLFCIPPLFILLNYWIVSLGYCPYYWYMQGLTSSHDLTDWLSTLCNLMGAKNNIIWNVATNVKKDICKVALFYILYTCHIEMKYLKIVWLFISFPIFFLQSLVALLMYPT